MTFATFHKGWLPLALLAAALIMLSCSEDREERFNPHPEGWLDQHSENFHGWPALDDSASGCRGCHGAELRGGTSGNSCYECHGYLHTLVELEDVQSHQRLLALDDDWNLANCAVCHGADYAGGASGVNCRGCHQAPNGPAQCGTCHSIPPVRDDSSKVPFTMTIEAAGAHDVHQRFGCRQCHNRAGGLSHVGPLPAEVLFDSSLARANGFNPSFEHIGPPTSGEGACSNIYCHSDGRGGPPVAMPQWVAGGLTCGGCHRIPPPEPHPQIVTCHECHQNVDPASNYAFPDSIRFIDESRHVDGAVTFGL